MPLVHGCDQVVRFFVFHAALPSKGDGLSLGDYFPMQTLKLMDPLRARQIMKSTIKVRFFNLWEHRRYVPP